MVQLLGNTDPKIDGHKRLSLSGIGAGDKQTIATDLFKPFSICVRRVFRRSATLFSWKREMILFLFEDRWINGLDAGSGIGHGKIASAQVSDFFSALYRKARGRNSIDPMKKYPILPCGLGFFHGLFQFTHGFPQSERIN